MLHVLLAISKEDSPSPTTGRGLKLLDKESLYDLVEDSPSPTTGRGLKRMINERSKVRVLIRPVQRLGVD